MYRGHDGIRKWFAETRESFEDLTTELTEFRDLGGFLSREDALAAAGLRE